MESDLDEDMMIEAWLLMRLRAGMRSIRTGQKMNEHSPIHMMTSLSTAQQTAGNADPSSGRSTIYGPVRHLQGTINGLPRVASYGGLISALNVQMNGVAGQKLRSVMS